ncbi:MAG: 16S rRNA processing protein RimM [Alphaproteobacteria bacterium]|nr:16S rRNA processing protein RimM [Alphaproteobacteria bacterium]|tara:strand:+ start:455 stop:958 length:504 start_codon:yes stop_codon:yes gene_type:complete
MDNKIAIAKVTMPHGIKGLVKLKLYADDPESFKTYSQYYLEDGSPVEITLKNALKGQYLAYIAGIEDRNAAEALGKAEIYINESQLNSVEEDEFYHRDLIGLMAVDKDGTKIGTVLAVSNFGGGDLLEVKPNNNTASFFIPFKSEFVQDIDIQTGCLRLNNHTDFIF